MNLIDLIANIHWIPVIVLTILSFVLGFAWHQPFLFGKAWKRENNPTNAPVKINAPLIFGGTAILHFVAIASLSALSAGLGAMVGFTNGLFVSIAWVLPSMGGTYLFANRSLKLLAIDAGMYTVVFSLFGLILGVW